MVVCSKCWTTSMIDPKIGFEIVWSKWVIFKEKILFFSIILIFEVSNICLNISRRCLRIWNFLHGISIGKEVRSVKTLWFFRHSFCGNFSALLEIFQWATIEPLQSLLFLSLEKFLLPFDAIKRLNDSFVVMLGFHPRGWVPHICKGEDVTDTVWDRAICFTNLPWLRQT